MRFRVAADFAALLEAEIRAGRLMAVNLADLKPTSALELTITLDGSDERVTVPARAVFEAGDLVGLQLDIESDRLHELAKMATAVLRPEGNAPLPVRTESRRPDRAPAEDRLARTPERAVPSRPEPVPAPEPEPDPDPDPEPDPFDSADRLFGEKAIGDSDEALDQVLEGAFDASFDDALVEKTSTRHVVLIPDDPGEVDPLERQPPHPESHPAPPAPSPWEEAPTAVHMRPPWPKVPEEEEEPGPFAHLRAGGSVETRSEDGPRLKTEPFERLRDLPPPSPATTGSSARPPGHGAAQRVDPRSGNSSGPIPPLEDTGDDPGPFRRTGEAARIAGGEPGLSDSTRRTAPRHGTGTGASTEPPGPFRDARATRPVDPRSGTSTGTAERVDPRSGTSTGASAGAGRDAPGPFRATGGSRRVDPRGGTSTSSAGVDPRSGTSTGASLEVSGPFRATGGARRVDPRSGTSTGTNPEVPGPSRDAGVGRRVDPRSGTSTGASPEVPGPSRATGGARRVDPRSGTSTGANPEVPGPSRDTGGARRVDPRSGTSTGAAERIDPYTGTSTRPGMPVEPPEPERGRTSAAPRAPERARPPVDGPLPPQSTEPYERATAPAGGFEHEPTAIRPLAPTDGTATATPTGPPQTGAFGSRGIDGLLPPAGPASAFRFLRRLQRTAAAGVLDLGDGVASRQARFGIGGHLIDCTGNLAGRLGALGLLDGATAERLAASGAGIATQVRFLLSEGSVPAAELLDGCVQEALELLEPPGDPPPAPFLFQPMDAEPEQALIIPFTQLAPAWVERATRPLTREDLDDRFYDRMLLYPVLRPAEGWGPSLLPLDGPHSRFITHVLPAGRTMRDVLSMSPLGRTKTYRFLILLEALDMLAYRETPPVAADDKEAVSLMRARLAAGQADLFVALGVHFSTHPAEYDAALASVRDEYGPKSAVAALSSDAARLARDVVALAEKAARSLRERGFRTAHRAENYDQTAIAGAADLLVRKARIADMRAQVLAAEQMREMAAELDPRSIVSPPR